MTWLLRILQEIVPVGSIVLSLISVATAWFTIRQTSKEVSDVREKVATIRNSRLKEEHVERPGTKEQPEPNDVDHSS